MQVGSEHRIHIVTELSQRQLLVELFSVLVAPNDTALSGHVVIEGSHDAIRVYRMAGLSFLAKVPSPPKIEEIATLVPLKQGTHLGSEHFIDVI